MAIAACLRRRILLECRPCCSSRRGMAKAAPTEGAAEALPVQRTWTGKVIKREKPIGDLWAARLQYRRDVAALRRKYREEVAREKVKKEQEQQAEQERMQKTREDRTVLKKQLKEESRLKHKEESDSLRLVLEEQRIRRAEYFKEMQAEVVEKKERQKLRVRKASCNWIEEKDLEMRILESMVEPVRLVGTTSAPRLDSFDTGPSSRGSRAKEDPLLRDSDDEVFSVFTRKSPRVTGQDILASVSKATTKLQF